jgi:ribulose-phosphate 3-epimerase
LPLDVHLMIIEPEKYLASFVQAGADILTMHVEASLHLHRTIQQIHDLGVRAGVALNPATPLGMVEEVLPALDLLLIMTVNPGFGGQVFIESALSKIARARAMLDRAGSKAELQVDGGISPQVARAVVAAGAQVLVAGTAIFGAPAGIAQAMQDMRRAV